MHRRWVSALDYFATSPSTGESSSSCGSCAGLGFSLHRSAKRLRMRVRRSSCWSAATGTTAGITGRLIVNAVYGQLVVQSPSGGIRLFRIMHDAKGRARRTCGGLFRSIGIGSLRPTTSHHRRQQASLLPAGNAGWVSNHRPAGSSASDGSALRTCRSCGFCAVRGTSSSFSR